MYIKDYKQYLSSVGWLIKKAELINLYLKFGLEIKCFICGNTNFLQVHHTSYDNVGGDETIDDLKFACIACHKRFHNDIEFKNKVLADEENKIIKFL